MFLQQINEIVGENFDLLNKISFVDNAKIFEIGTLKKHVKRTYMKRLEYQNCQMSNSCEVSSVRNFVIVAPENPNFSDGKT